jgi:uncharacterized protein DUF4126
MSFSPANITALVIAASFAAGLNIYATVLTLGILARTQWVALPPGLGSLGHTWVIADKIPGFDLIWNALHTIVRVPIAALVAYHASSQLTPEMQILATALGAAIALAAHGSKTALRAAVTPSLEPLQHRPQHNRRRRSRRPHLVRNPPPGHGRLHRSSSLWPLPLPSHVPFCAPFSDHCDVSSAPTLTRNKSLRNELRRPNACHTR